jgi:threonine/homoserine/homoserine lactone efflux protein
VIAGAASAALTGAALGLSSGLSPGPLLALVIVQSLSYSVREGVKVAAAPLLTDLPIVAAALGLTFAAAGQPRLLGALTLLGALFLAKCAWDSLRFAGPAETRPQALPRSVQKGMLANFLNPSPYLFWGAVGAPLLAQCWASGWGTAAAFLAGFYACLVGSKVVVAWLTGRLGPVMGSRGYVWVMRGLGLLLLACAGLLARDAWKLFTP